MGETARHAAKLQTGSYHEGRLANLADDDPKLSACVHRAS
jgi:hypothetical protein